MSIAVLRLEFPGVQRFDHILDLRLQIGNEEGEAQVAERPPDIRGDQVQHLLRRRREQPDPQVAIMPRYRLHLGPGVATLGAGVSAGHYTVPASPFASDPISEQSYAMWANAETGYEMTWRSGMFVRAYFGGSKVIAHGAVTDGRGNHFAMSSDTSALPYTGIMFGYAF